MMATVMIAWTKWYEAEAEALGTVAAVVVVGVGVGWGGVVVAVVFAMKISWYRQCDDEDRARRNINDADDHADAAAAVDVAREGGRVVTSMLLLLMRVVLSCW